jgi:hypothetical protein
VSAVIAKTCRHKTLYLIRNLLSYSLQNLSDKFFLVTLKLNCVLDFPHNSIKSKPKMYRKVIKGSYKGKEE